MTGTVFSFFLTSLAMIHYAFVNLTFAVLPLFFCIFMCRQIQLASDA